MARKTTPGQYPRIQNCTVLGIDRIVVDQYGDQEEFFEIKAEWADNTVLVLRRSWIDFTRILKKLRDSFLEEFEPSAESLLLEGLRSIKDAEESDNVTRLECVEAFLRTVVTMPCKYSQSDVVLSFFEASNLDMMLGHNLEPSQLLMYSPITVSEVRRSNGFCLANTETIICDSRLPDERPLSTDSATPEYEKRSIAVENRDSLLDLAGEDKRAPNPTIDISHITRTEPNPIMKPPRQGMAPEVYISKMTYLHMDAHETDILE